MNSYDEIANKLKAIAHPTRLHILDLLRHGQTCVCHIERTLDKRQAYISQQLMLLRDVGLVQSSKEGLRVYYRLADDQVAHWLALLVGPPTAQKLTKLDDCPCPSCLNAPTIENKNEEITPC